MATQSSNPIPQDEKKQPSRWSQALTFFLIGISMVVVTGLAFWAYQNLSSIVSTVIEAGEVDQNGVRLKEVMREIAEAESSVKSFSLTGDLDHLEPFIRSANNIDLHLDELKEANSSDSLKSALTTELSDLIEEKFYVLQEILEKQDAFDANLVISRFSRKVDNVEVAETMLETSLEREDSIADLPESSVENAAGDLANFSFSQPEDPEEGEGAKLATGGEEESAPPVMEEEKKKKKGNIFKRIFGGKKNQDIEERDTSDAISEVDSTENQEKTETTEEIVQEAIQKELKREIARLREEASEAELKEKEKELELLRRDFEINQELNNLVFQIERLNEEEQYHTAQEASRMTKKANQSILYFCIVAGISLILLGFGIADYFRKNRKYNEQTDLARREAERLARTRERFLANMSHEIRTPMHAIVGFTDELLRDADQDEEKEQLGVIKASAGHLLELLNSILDYSRLDADKMPLVPRPMELEPLMNTVGAWTENAVRGKQVTFKYEGPETRFPVVEADALRLRQVLLNLLSNAVKFTKEGKVTLKTSVLEQKDDEICIRFEVQDTGLGIPKAQQKRIFEAFHQADDTTVQTHGGTGLGLAITRQIVAGMEGDIQLESEEGKGSTFRLDLPFPITKETPEADLLADGTWKPDTLTGVSILIADDAPFNLRFLDALLGRQGANITTCNNGQEAVQAMEKEKFDIALLDWRMPVLDGAEVVQKIRAGKTSNAKTPMVVLTAAPDSETRKMLLDSGFNDILLKPFQETDLMNLIVRILNLKTIDPMPETPLSPPEKNGKPFSLEHLERSVRGNKAFRDEMIQSFLTLSKEAEKNWGEAADKKDWKQMAEAAHRLAGPVKHFEAKMLYKSLKELENTGRSGGPEEKMLQVQQDVENELAKLRSFLEQNLQ